MCNAAIRASIRVIDAMLGVCLGKLDELYMDSGKKETRLLQALSAVKMARRALTDILENHSHV